MAQTLSISKSPPYIGEATHTLQPPPLASTTLMLSSYGDFPPFP